MINPMDVEKDPSFWQFCTIIWKEHPWIFVLLVIISWGGIGAIRNKCSFLEYWINGYTPKFLRKKRTHNRRADDKEEKK